MVYSYDWVLHCKENKLYVTVWINLMNLYNIFLTILSKRSPIQKIVLFIKWVYEIGSKNHIYFSGKIVTERGGRRASGVLGIVCLLNYLLMSWVCSHCENSKLFCMHGTQQQNVFRKNKWREKVFVANTLPRINSLKTKSSRFFIKNIFFNYTLYSMLLCLLW